MEEQAVIEDRKFEEIEFEQELAQQEEVQLEQDKEAEDAIDEVIAQPELEQAE